MARVARVIANDTGEDLTEIVNAEATRHGLPPELLVALGIAESELNVQSQRWAKLTAQAREALAAGDFPRLEEILANIAASDTPHDISFGLFQQTVRFAAEGDHTGSLANVLMIRDLYWNAVHAAAVAAKQLGFFFHKFNDPLEALCRYNKPSLAGIENPTRPRYRDSLERAQAFLAEDLGDGPIGGVTMPFDFEVDTQISPNQSPSRPQTIGVVIHATRGPTANQATDYKATINHFLNPASEVSAHMVVGPIMACRMVDDASIAFHAKARNATHLGIEMAQPDSEPPFTDFEYRAASAIVREWCQKFNIPVVHVHNSTDRGIVGHEEVDNQKSDPGSKFDWDRFIGLVRQQPVVVPPAPTTRVLGEGFRTFVRDHPEVGEPRHDEAYDLFGNAYVWLTASPAHPKGALLLWRKWLNQTKLVAWEADAAVLASGTIGEYLAAHPELGRPRHELQGDALDNRYVWLAVDQAHPHGALLYWRRWLNAVQLISWEDQPAIVNNGAALAGPVQEVVAQCQVERANYDSDADYLTWAAPQANGTFDTASCSAAALAAVLTAYGRPTNISAAVRILGPGRISPQHGLLDASLGAMRDALAAIDIQAERADLSYDELLGRLNDRAPVILDLPGMFNGIGHIMVAVSGTADACEVADSARRERPRWSATRAVLESFSRRTDRKLAGLRLVG